MQQEEIKRVECPTCHKRIFDKQKGCVGYLSIKCPHCKSIVRINLALRKPRSSYNPYSLLGYLNRA